VHDGQVMVRLKKKRFIIIDYSIEPTDEDVQAAQQSPHIKIFEGAGKRKCNMAKCNKVGVPVCLFDSEPDSTDSLYLRSGLCFSCQRNLNEKRRTERKRAPKAGDVDSGSPSILYAIGPSHKKFKLNGNTIHLNSDAVIVNGAVDGLKHCGDGYGFQEIGSDLQALAKEASGDVDRLVDAVSGASVPGGDESLSAEATASAVVEASSGLLGDGGDDSGNGDSGSPNNISVLYEKAFKSMNKSIFLLSQWKMSWDAAVETVTDPSLADAVASAAAVVAAAADGQDGQNSNMVSLLLAADKKKGAKGGGSAGGGHSSDGEMEVSGV